MSGDIQTFSPCASVNHIGKLYVSLIWRGWNTMRNVPRRMELRAWWWYTPVYTSGVPNRLPPPNPPRGPPTPLSTTTWTYPSVIRAPLPHHQLKWVVEPTAIHEKTERRCDGAHHERITHGSWNREQVKSMVAHHKHRQRFWQSDDGMSNENEVKENDVNNTGWKMRETSQLFKKNPR